MLLKGQVAFELSEAMAESKKIRKKIIYIYVRNDVHHTSR